MTDVFAVSYIANEDVAVYYLLNKDGNYDFFHDKCIEFLPDAGVNAIYNNYHTWVGWKDILDELLVLLASEKFKQIDLSTLDDYVVNEIVLTKESVSLLGAALDMVAEHNERINNKMNDKVS